MSRRCLPAQATSSCCGQEAQLTGRRELLPIPRIGSIRSEPDTIVCEGHRFDAITREHTEESDMEETQAQRASNRRACMDGQPAWYALHGGSVRLSFDAFFGKLARPSSRRLIT